VNEPQWNEQLLAGEVAVVTGAGQGIGLAVATELASVGASVALFEREGDRVQTAAEAVREKATGGAVQGLQVDVTDWDGVQRAVDQVATSLGNVTILVNNAGILRDAFFRKMTLAQFDEVIDVHLRGNFICSKACVESMCSGDHGAIVSLSSSTGPFGNPGQANYGAAKAGIIGMTRTMALELVRYNIRVNAIAPGAVDTPMMRSIPEKVLEGFMKLMPMGRLAEPAEVARLATFLASPLASYITGHVYFVDGGSTVAG
jgi:3-oxoacyl-[acyl-carrier protein] reductase